MRKRIFIAVMLSMLVTLTSCTLFSSKDLQIWLDDTAVDATYSETIEYERGLTIDSLGEQILHRLRVEEKGEDITDTLTLLESDAIAGLDTYTLSFAKPGEETALFCYEVTLRDTTAPTLWAKQSYTVQTGAVFDASHLELEVYDSCDVNVLDRVELGEVDTTTLGIKSTEVSVSDQSGNTASLPIEITVSDEGAVPAVGRQVFLWQDSDDLYVLLNGTHVLPDGWEPDDLESISHDGDAQHYLRTEAKEAWEQLYAAAKADGITINVVSSFRTQAYQEQLFTSYLSIDPDAASYSAAPRTSEHELGLTLDISYDAFLHDDLQTSALGKWMAENSYRYGWIVRYPQGKEDITQYIYEPWHYRYVGKTLAYKLHEQNLTLEEYYDQQTKEAAA